MQGRRVVVLGNKHAEPFSFDLLRAISGAFSGQGKCTIRGKFEFRMQVLQINLNLPLGNNGNEKDAGTFDGTSSRQHSTPAFPR